MDFSNFVEFVPEKRRTRAFANPIFATMKTSSMAFSRGTTKALKASPYVKLMINDEEKQFALLPADEGVSYLKEGRDENAIIIWHNKELISRIKAMLPEGQKEGVRILGSEVEEGIVFNCTDLKEMRRSRD